MRNHGLRATRRALLVVPILILSITVPSSAVSAHGNCAGDANGPYKYNNGNRIKGKVSYVCTDQHDAYEVRGCLQKRVSGTWRDRHCLRLVIGPNLSGVTQVFVEPNESCSTGSWRTVFLLGVAYNESGSVAHRQDTNEQSPVSTFNSC